MSWNVSAHCSIYNINTQERSSFTGDNQFK